MSGLALDKDTYVTSWEISLTPEDEDKIMYKYIILPIFFAKIDPFSRSQFQEFFLI